MVRQVLGGSCFPYVEVHSLIRRDCVEAFRRGIEGRVTARALEIVEEREVVRRR